MKRHSMFRAVLAVGMALGVVVVAPSAAVAEPVAAAQCQYVAQDLPLPTGVVGTEAVASSSNNTLILGAVQNQLDNSPGAVLWRDGQVYLQLSKPSFTTVIPKGVNKNAVVVGALRHNFNGTTTAFRWLVGRYFPLDTPAGYGSVANAINDSGDITGAIFPLATPDQRIPVVWAANKPSHTRLVGQGEGIAVTPARYAVTNKGEVHNIVAGTSTFLLHSQAPFAVQNEQVYGFGLSSIPQWNTAAQMIAIHDKGVQPIGANDTTLYATFGPTEPVPGLLANGEWTAIQTLRPPNAAQYGDITEDGTLIGNTLDGKAARWTCAEAK